MKNGRKREGKEAVKLLQDTLYGDFLIKLFDFDLYKHTVTMLVVLHRPIDIDAKQYEEEKYIARFTNVSRFKLEKDDADEPWEELWWAYLWYIPKDKNILHLTDEEKEKYDFLIEGDFYYFLIKGNLEVEPYEEEQSRE